MILALLCGLRWNLFVFVNVWLMRPMSWLVIGKERESER